MPLVAAGYGPAAMARGDVLPWAFAPPATVWDSLSVALAYVGQGGSEDSPQGRSLAYVHRDSPAGREPEPVLRALAAEAGLAFRAYALPDGASAEENTAPWRAVRAADPDYVILDATAGLSGTPLRDAAAAGCRSTASSWSAGPARTTCCGRAPAPGISPPRACAP